MEEDDDMFLVIVGDECKNTEQIETSVIKMDIKEEALDEFEDPSLVSDLIETATTYGEVIKVENLYEETNDELQSGNDVDAKEEYCSDDDEEPEPKRRGKLLEPAVCKSFVRQLRKQYPETKKDRGLLVKKLHQHMEEVKATRPNPPDDFFIVSSDTCDEAVILYQCTKCGASLIGSEAASRHYREKHGPRYLNCLACGVDFRSTTPLYKHERRCLSPDAKVVLQARALFVGSKSRDRPLYFKKNLKDVISKPRKKYKCKLCPAEFLMAQALTSHEYTHRGERPFICSQCPAAYTSNSALQKHSKKHTDEIYICDHCKRGYKLKQTLITHLDTHLPMKRHVCGECGRRFAQKFALTLHIDGAHRHLPPPFACQVCPKRFRRTSVLKTHMMKMHGMCIMTRNMFFKMLPMMTDWQLEQAKVILKSDVLSNENAWGYSKYDYTYKPRPRHIKSESQTEVNELPSEVMEYVKKLQKDCGVDEFKVVVIENAKELNLDVKRTLKNVDDGSVVIVKVENDECTQKGSQEPLDGKRKKRGRKNNEV